MEQSCRILKPKKYKALKARIETAVAAGIMSSDFHLELFNAINPVAMSPADMEMINEFNSMYP